MRRLMAASFAFASACVPPTSPPADDAGRSDGGGAAACPLSEDAKILLQQTLDGWVRDTGTVGAHMRDEAAARESAYAISLVGNPSKGRAGFAFLVQSCTETMAFDPYCEPFDFEDERAGQLCLRLSCEAADILVSEAWYAEDGRTDIDDRHVFTTTTESPAGEVVYDPNPFVAWRADVTNDADVAVTSRIDVGAVVTPTGGDPIDMSHEGDVAARRVLVDDHEEVSIEIDLTFGDLSEGGDVVASIAVAQDGAMTGGVDHAGVRIADLPASYDGEVGLQLVWAGDCTD